MQLSVRSFLLARFTAMLCWVVLLVAGYLVYRSLAPMISNDFARWVLRVATLAASIWAGYALQRRVLNRLDPEGELRRRDHQESQDAHRNA